MPHHLTTILLLLALVAACDNEAPTPDASTSSSSSGSSGDLEPTGGSSSETSEPSWSTGEDPDPRPLDGLFAHCEQDDENECPGGALVCFKDEVAWGTGPGVCTQLLCESVNDCIPEGGLPKSGAELRCTEVTDDAKLKACVLQCEDHDECPGGMICLDLPSPQPGLQKICV